MKIYCRLIVAAIAGIVFSSCNSQPDLSDPSVAINSSRQPASDLTNSVPATKPLVRFATFNTALNRKQPGELVRDLQSGQSPKFIQIAEVIQRVRPHVILLNEVDRDTDGQAVRLLCEKYLAKGQNGQQPIEYPHVYSGSVNTGVLSGLDMNQDGKIELPDDGYGFGAFPGQYGMVVLSQFPIDRSNLRTFQKFLWKDMPNATVPAYPDTGKPFYPDEVWNAIRLSSKSHWDIPIRIRNQVVHLVCAHPTPPVFDGDEDRNGARNHDEIRLIADLISGTAGYLVDDQGQKGGLPAGSQFVVVGDLNADPNDGDSVKHAARQLTTHPDINHSRTPASRGAVEAARLSGGKNKHHQGDHAHDTGDFNDSRVGNVRIDYCLPGTNLPLVDCGVFWPASDQPGHELNSASDHHLVWIDVRLD